MKLKPQKQILKRSHSFCEREVNASAKTRRLHSRRLTIVQETTVEDKKFYCKIRHVSSGYYVSCGPNKEVLGRYDESPEPLLAWRLFGNSASYYVFGKEEGDGSYTYMTHKGLGKEFKFECSSIDPSGINLEKLEDPRLLYFDIHNNLVVASAKSRYASMKRVSDTISFVVGEEEGEQWQLSTTGVKTESIQHSRFCFVK